MSESKARIKPVCTTCDSDNVMADAFASWDVDEQQWELANSFDDMYCEACDMSCKVKWIEA